MHIAIPAWLTGAVAAVVLSAAARALPDPTPSGSRLYLWLYRFAQNLLANFDKGNRTPDGFSFAAWKREGK
jgi:hypothetical protein